MTFVLCFSNRIHLIKGVVDMETNLANGDQGTARGRTLLQNGAQVVIGVFAFAVIFVPIYIFSSQMVQARGNIFDFFPHYTAAQFFWQGVSPYTPEANLYVQTNMFGGRLPLDSDQFRIIYPAYASLILAPFLLLPVSTAIALWMTLQFVAIVFAMLWWIRLLAWKPSVWVLALLVLGLTIAFRYPINTYLVAQFIGTMMLGFVIVIWLLMQRRDVAAGFVCALLTFSPTIAVPLSLILLAVYAWQRRPRALIVFIATLAVMTAITILRIGWWIPDLLNNIIAYGSYGNTRWAFTTLGSPVLSVVLMVAVGGSLWWAIRHTMSDRPLELLSVAIFSLLILLPQTGNYYLTLLILPILTILKRSLSPTVPPLGRWGVRLALIGVIASIWVLVRFPDIKIEHLLLPLEVGVIWWVLWFMEPRTPIVRASSPKS